MHFPFVVLDPEIGGSGEQTHKHTKRRLISSNEITIYIRMDGCRFLCRRGCRYKNVFDLFIIALLFDADRVRGLPGWMRSFEE